MNAEKFWHGWLKVAAILCTLFGVLIALFNQTPAFDFINRYIERLFYTSTQFALDVSPLKGWLCSVLGATMAGWGISMLFLVLYPLQKKELWSWNAIMLSLIIWFSIDTYLSSYYGATFNVIINIVFALQFFAPLLFLRTTMLASHKIESISETTPG